MKKKLAVLMVLGLLITNVVHASSKITDIEGSSFKPAIENVLDKGYMGLTNIEKGTFSPKNQVTREQLAQILTNFETTLEEKQQEESNKELTAIANTMNGVVKIDNGKGLGTGVFIDETTILTALHVVSHEGNIVDIYLSDYRGSVKATVTDIDDWNDLALLKIDNTLKKDNYKVRPVPIAKEEPLLGETIYAYGNPKKMDFSVTRGIISNLSRNVNSRSKYQFDAIVHPGNSGGPLVNSNGEIVGIVNSILGEEQGTVALFGINFATKLYPIQSLVESKE